MINPGPNSEFQSTQEHIQQQGQEVFDVIEKPNWAPWLRVDASQIADRMIVFPSGHVSVRDGGGRLVGFLSTNRISWDGGSESLPTWDLVAGSNGTYRDTYKPEGNTVCLMSMGVAAGAKGQNVARGMVSEIQKFARESGVDHIIGDFRPSGFGHFKHMTSNFDFDEYVSQKRGDGLPLDPWLRNVTHQGMQPLGVDHRAMVVKTSIDELNSYMTKYRPEAWYEVEDPEDQKVLLEQHRPDLDLEEITHILECEETGTWYVDAVNNQAVYIESNYWGELPLE